MLSRLTLFLLNSLHLPHCLLGYCSHCPAPLVTMNIKMMSPEDPTILRCILSSFDRTIERSQTLSHLRLFFLPKFFE